MQHLPPTRDIFRSGIYYILPILLLMYLLMIERKSPGLSAFWSTIGMLFILLTQNPLKGYFRGERRPLSHVAEGSRILPRG